MLSVYESIIILVVGIALVLIAREFTIDAIVNKVLYIIGVILIIIGILFFVLGIISL